MQRLGVHGADVTVPISLDALFNLGQTRISAADELVAADDRAG